LGQLQLIKRNGTPVPKLKTVTTSIFTVGYKEHKKSFFPKLSDSRLSSGLLCLRRHRQRQKSPKRDRERERQHNHKRKRQKIGKGDGDTDTGKDRSKGKGKCVIIVIDSDSDDESDSRDKNEDCVITRKEEELEKNRWWTSQLCDQPQRQKKKIRKTERRGLRGPVIPSYDPVEFNKSWLKDEIFVAPSKVHGSGVFSKVHLRAGEVIGSYAWDCEFLSLQQVDELPDSAQDYVLKLSTEDGTDIYVNGEHSTHFGPKINHRFKGHMGANVCFDTYGYIHVMRDIFGTETDPVELFADYGFPYWADKLLNIDYLKVALAQQKTINNELRARLSHSVLV